MGLETATYINGLVVSNPAGGDDRSQGDDHIRLVKSAIKNTFPNIDGAITLTEEVINALPTTKANLASPALTGVPTAPTAAPGDNTTQLATTAFVTAADALKANIASPTFTGVPAGPTAAPGTNTTQLATTAFVKVAADGSVFGSGQTWQDVTGSRALSTDYTNSTGRPIMVSVSTETVTGNASLVGRIGGVEVARQQLASGGAITSVTNITLIVPAGAVYRFTGTTSLKLWAELR